MKQLAICVAALAAALSAATCFSPDYQSGIECSPGGECPSGFECASDGVCYPEGEGPPDASVGGDGGGPGTDGGGIDAAPATFTVGGTVSSLMLPPVVLRLGDESLEVTEGGEFTFQTELPTGAEYDVGISTQPEGEETCVVANGRGIVGHQDVTDVEVECYRVVFQVNNVTDEPDLNPGDGACMDNSLQCSLRAAVQEANNAGERALILLPMEQFFLEQPFTEGPADAGEGDLDVTRSIRIVGESAEETVVSGNGLTRIFEVHPDASLTLDRLTLREAGVVGAEGGAIRVAPGATTRLRHVVMRNNFTDLRGGAISNSGSLSVLKSRVIENEAPINGGGIYSDAEARIEKTLFLRNTTGDGGSAVMNDGGTVTIINSTFSENRAGENSETEEGGALFLRGLAEISHITVTNNVTPSTAARGGGIFADADSEVILTSSIVAGNTAMQAVDCTGTIISGGQNLIGDVSGCEFQEMQGDQVGTGDASIDPLLGALENIRSTRGHAPQEGSPAIDAAGVMCATHDQAGRPRPADGDGDGEPACDVGAIEAQ